MISCGLTLVCIVLAICAAIYVTPLIGDLIAAYYRLSQHITEIERFTFAGPMIILLWGHCISFKLEDSNCHDFKLGLCIINALLWNVTSMLYACYIMTVGKQSGMAYGYWGEVILGIFLFFSFVFVVTDAWDQIKQLNARNKAARIK